MYMQRIPVATGSSAPQRYSHPSTRPMLRRRAPTGME